MTALLLNRFWSLRLQMGAQDQGLAEGMLRRCSHSEPWTHAAVEVHHVCVPRLLTY